MIQVSSPSHFPEDAHIAFFSGKNYAEAIQLAESEANRVGVSLISYYEQKAPGKSKSILVSYKKKEEENENSNL